MSRRSVATPFPPACAWAGTLARLSLSQPGSSSALRSMMRGIADSMGRQTGGSRVRSELMRVALALLMIVHGIAHLVGFVVPWRLIELPAQPYRTTILRGAVDFGEAGIRLYAGAWLILAVSFAALAAGLLLRAQWWYRDSLLAGGVSALLCVLSWPDTRFRRTR